MNLQRYRKMLLLLVIIGSVFLAPSVIFADESGEKTFSLTDTNEVQITNGVESSITILAGEERIFERELSLVKVVDVQIIEANEREFIIIEYRHDGSSNALFFDVLALNNGETQHVFTSDTYYNAFFHIDNDQITVTYPEYGKDFIQTEPTSLVTVEFAMKDTQVQIEEENVEILENNQHSSIDKFEGKVDVNNYRENLPYEEVNKILTEEAIKANVSPEIVKAIAYQESGWQQYWETVPESVKQCPNYDGTNVKLGYDCIGLGIMQISNQMYMEDGPEKERYIERLKTDIRFNIQEGIQILKDKWNYSNSGIIPTINDNDPLILENWYFAIMAYNGLLPRNNPLERPFSPHGAYQEEVMERLKDQTLLDVYPFPTHLLDPYIRDDGQLRFHTDNFQIDGPFHLSSQMLETGDISYVTENRVNLRNSPGGTVIGSLNKGTKVTITDSYVGTGSRYNQYVWFPITTDAGQTGWMASSYLSPSNEYMKKYRLSGPRRYETSVSITNFGWHWDQPSSVVIGRGDLPIDALTGSVLASQLDSPLLLTHNHTLTDIVKKEISRLQPSQIYILGGDKTAISPEVEAELKEMIGNSNVQRISGSTRYETAVEVAKQLNNNTNEIFVTTGDASSSDALAIAPYAGENGIPILLTRKNQLDSNITEYINSHNINKVTIIGGTDVVNQSVKRQLESLVNDVERVSGATRYSTATAIIDKYYDTNTFRRVFLAQGLETADALSGSPYAAKLHSPVLLTRNNSIPTEVEEWIEGNITSKPNLFLLGGTAAISDRVANEMMDLLK